MPRYPHGDATQKRSRIEWSIAPTDDKGTELLREKIRSKMGIAQLLGAFITLVLSGVVLDPDRLNDLGRGWAVSLSAVLFLGAIALYAATMYAYDSLLMPSRFWAESPATPRAAPRTVRRPPSSVNWILYENMLRLWNWLFTPATALVLVGLLLLSYAALQPPWALAMTTGAIAVVIAAYLRWYRPDIGSQDCNDRLSRALLHYGVPFHASGRTLPTARRASVCLKARAPVRFAAGRRCRVSSRAAAPVPR